MIDFHHPQFKHYAPNDLQGVADDLRQFIIDRVSQQGGHFAANLGVIELTVALHYFLNLPQDHLIWDVGHQAYAHKILSDRKDRFFSNRKMGGISGFPKRLESEYDAFGVGHSSTSISAALGMAEGRRIKNDSRRIVAVIGDGALTAGQAYEALNHLAHLQSPVLVVVNDNQISIDPTVGITLSAAFFESLGLNYLGPMDGHSIPEILDSLKIWDENYSDRPLVLHLKTTKGKGFLPAEQEQTRWHAPGKFDKITGTLAPKSTTDLPTYQQVFGKTMVELAEKFPHLVSITPAMTSGSNLLEFQEKFPDRFFDTGITEQHAVTFAAGLATQGIRPVLAIYSTFLQRGYDQLIHDVALQQLPVIFAIDRAGLVGEDGPTHHGVFDIAALNAIPNMILAAPSDGLELRNLLFSALQWDQPVAIRYPRSRIPAEIPTVANFQSLPLGKARRIQTGASGVAVLVYGAFLASVLHAISSLESEVTVIDMRFAKPLDDVLLEEVSKEAPIWVTVEDGTLNGGFGSIVQQWVSNRGKMNQVFTLGVPDQFIEHGKFEELHQLLGLDTEGFSRYFKQLFGENDESDLNFME